VSLTHEYTALHTALAAAAATNAVTPFECRVVLALDEADFVPTYDELAGLLQNEGSAIRRAGALLDKLGYARRRGADGRHSRPGVHTQLVLTDRGRGLADEVRQHHRVLLPERAAA
jgi:hypothetical protein